MIALNIFRRGGGCREAVVIPCKRADAGDPGSSRLPHFIYSFLMFRELNGAFCQAEKNLGAGEGVEAVD